MSTTPPLTCPEPPLPPSRRWRRATWVLVSAASLAGVLTVPAAAAVRTPAANFTLSATAKTVQLSVGKPASVQVTAKRSPALRSTVSFTVRSTLRGVTISTSKSAADQVVITLAAGPKAPLKQGRVTVTARSGKQSKAIRLVVRVVPASATPAGAGSEAVIPATVVAPVPSPTPPPTPPPTPVPPTPAPSTGSVTTVASGDFRVLPATPSGYEQNAGETGHLYINVIRTGGYRGSPTFTFLGLPTTVEVFAPKIAPNGPDNLTYDFEVKSSLTANVGFTAKVRATDGSIVHETDLKFTIQPMKTQFNFAPVTKAAAPGEAAAFTFVINNLDGSRPHYLVWNAFNSAFPLTTAPVVAEAKSETTMPLNIPVSVVDQVVDVKVLIAHVSDITKVTAIVVKVKVTRKPVIFEPTAQFDWFRQDPTYLGVNYTTVSGVAPPSYTASTTMPGVDVTFDPDVLGTRGFLRVYINRRSGTAAVPPGIYTVTLRATSGSQDADAVWKVTVKS
jgi:hypothetical protein